MSGSASTSGTGAGKKGDPATASQTSAGAHEGSPGLTGEEFELLLVRNLLYFLFNDGFR